MNQKEKNSETFKTLFEGISEAILIVDKDLKISELNTSAEKLFQYERDQLLNQSINLLIPHRFHNTHDQYAKSFVMKNEKRLMRSDREISGLKKKEKNFR